MSIDADIVFSPAIRKVAIVIVHHTPASIA